MHAAGVVANHATERASVVGCRVWTERQMVFFGGVAQTIEDDPGLDSRYAPRRINLDDVPHVPGEIEHYGNVAALPGERGAGAPAQYGRAIFSRQRNACDNIVG